MLDSLLSARTAEYSAKQSQLRDTGTQLKLAQNRQNASGQELARATDQIQAATAGIEGMALEGVKDMRFQLLDTGGNVTATAVIVTADRTRRALNDFLYGTVFDPTWDAAAEGAYWTAVLAADAPARTTWEGDYGLTDAHWRLYKHYLANYAVLEEVREMEDLLALVIKDPTALRRLGKILGSASDASLAELRAISGMATRSVQLSETFDFTSPEGVNLMRRRIRSRILVDAEANSLLGDLDMVTGAALDVTGRTCVKPGDSQEIQAALDRIHARLNPYADVLTQAGRNAAAQALLGQAGNSGDAAELSADLLNLLTSSDPDATLDAEADAYISDLGFSITTGGLRIKLQAFLDSLKAGGMSDALLSDTFGHVKEWSARALGDSLRARGYDACWNAFVQGGSARAAFISDLRAAILNITDATAWASRWAAYQSGVSSSVDPIDAPAVLDAGFAALPFSLRRTLPALAGYRAELASLLADDVAQVGGIPQDSADTILRCVDRLNADFVDSETADASRNAILVALTKLSPTGPRQRSRFLASVLSDGVYFTGADFTQMDATAAATLNSTLLDLYATLRTSTAQGSYLTALRASIVSRVGSTYAARVATLAGSMVPAQDATAPDTHAIQLFRFAVAECVFWYDMTVAPSSDWVTRAGDLLDLSSLGSSVGQSAGDAATPGMLASLDSYSGGTVSVELRSLAYNEVSPSIVSAVDDNIVFNAGADSASISLWRDYQQAWLDAYAEAYADTAHSRDKILQVAEAIGSVPGRLADQFQNIGDQYAKLINNSGPKLRMGTDPDNTLYNYSLIGIGGFGDYTGSISGVVTKPKYALVGGDRLMSKVHQFLTQETIVHKAAARVTVYVNTLGVGVSHITSKVADMRTGIEAFQQSMAQSQAAVGAKISSAIAQVLCLLDLVHDLIKELNGAISSLLGAVNNAIGGIKGLIGKLNGLINTIKDTLAAMAKALANLLRPKIGGGVNCACMSMGFVLGINSRNPFDDLADWLSALNFQIPDPFSTLDFSLDPKLGCPQNLLQGVLPPSLLSSSSIGGTVLGPLKGGVGLVFA